MNKLTLTWALVLCSFSSLAQEYDQKPPELTRILFLLDGSGSMLAPFEGATRIQAAKEVLSNLVDSLSLVENVELALRVYGHQYPRSQQNCRDTRLEVSFSPDNHNLIKTRLDMIRPKGTTPLAFSLEQAAKDFPEQKDVRNVLIIITDGLESCDGDPCSISLEIQKKGVLLKPFVIGLGLDLEVKERFDCLGKYLVANRLSEFKQALTQVTRQSLSKTTVTVELLDINKGKTEKDINVTFINNFTKLPVYDFVHFRDSKGRPDTLEIDPVTTYDVMVNTVPAVYKKNVPIIPGQHNVIEIQSPRGSLFVSQKNTSEYKNAVKALVRTSDKAEVIDVINLNEIHQYLVGQYDLEILTLPRTYLKDIQINQSTTKTIAIEDPGIVNVKLNSEGILSAYEISPNGAQRWLKNLERDKKAFTFALQPGKYKIVYRAHKAKGSKFTEVRTFHVLSGATVNLNF